jgi:hypothetical protein
MIWEGSRQFNEIQFVRLPKRRVQKAYCFFSSAVQLVRTLSGNALLSSAAVPTKRSPSDGLRHLFVLILLYQLY